MNGPTGATSGTPTVDEPAGGLADAAGDDPGRADAEAPVEDQDGASDGGQLLGALDVDVPPQPEDRVGQGDQFGVEAPLVDVVRTGGAAGDVGGEAGAGHAAAEEAGAHRL